MTEISKSSPFDFLGYLIRLTATYDYSRVAVVVAYTKSATCARS